MWKLNDESMKIEITEEVSNGYSLFVWRSQVGNRVHVDWVWLVVSIICGILGAVGTMLCVLWLAVGTLFFDDPTITYSEFLLSVGKYIAIPIFLLLVSGWSIYKYRQARKK
ncbi:hypothetical protein [Paenibacillus sacheonensis]|uniref:Uncharacterized protein n=1 Tax=Paenibacillus sacheonensis TaxID=742054 RepID=A0A7X5C0C0_9BACL|nr:hypothetical protein [Paenibacillus sacheonensis]MBM7569519.1 hypothetical protein [Paenibacillus sacheonensis]NBC73578.1 hypothetical protein [Paenibacillus sacheonensis]